MTKSFLISDLIIKQWKKEVGKLLSEDQWKRTAVLLSFILIIFTAGGAGYSITQTLLSMFLQGDERSLVLLVFSMFINTSIFSFLLYVIFKTMTPEQDRLHIQLSWFPVSSFEKQTGYFIPFLGVITLLVMSFMGILLIPGLLFEGIGILFILFFFLGLTVQSLFIVSIVHGAYQLAYFITSRLRFPFPKHISLLLIMLAGIAAGFQSIQTDKIIGAYEAFTYDLFYMTAPFFLIYDNLLSVMTVNLHIIAGVVIAGLFSPILAMLLPVPVKEQKKWKLLSSIPMPRNKFGAVMSKELKTQARNEDNILMFLVVLILLGAAGFFFELHNAVFLLYILAGITGLSGLNSYGNDHHLFKLYNLYSLNAGKILLAKLAALWSFSIAQFSVYALFFIGAGAGIMQWMICLLILINANLLLFIAGTIIPMNRNSPLTGMISFSCLLIVLVPLLFIMNSVLTAAAASVLITFAVLLEAALFAGAYHSVKWRLSSEPL
ncbi:hypothetical protein CR205_09265 [Alteribacter lacisalsi]|uniref:Uncharacterized protein n=1 Tax=Alteribacter lacisalsi TaxID=2045244 RepID=A0A2W0HA63_9BACI|nr:hypothetical protein [Alteribacter lacisalsi]PYZ98744.1 hypothetical protein CR205_09265 [Alteribacter lacisalsi]